MLSDIRNASKSGWTYILVGVLIVVFAVFFGAPIDSCGGPKNRVLLAKVGGDDLHTDDLNPIFNRVYGTRRTVEDSQLLKQQSTSLRALILIHLLSERAMDAGIRVSEEEFQKYVKNFYRNPEFRLYSQNGTFDGPQYKNWVQYGLRVSIPAYEDFKRRELLARKWLETIEMQYQAADWEIEELHQLRNNKVDLEYLKFDPARIQELVPVTQEEVDQYLASNASEIKKYYEENKADYEDPAQVRIRRIFILKPGADEGDDARDAAKKKFDTARERVKGEEFADVAGDMTEDYAKEKQGLMDWSTTENLDQNIATAIEGAKVGDVREVETDFAYMLVKLEDQKEAKTTSLEEVRTEIARLQLQTQKVDTEVERLVKQVRTKLDEEGIDSLQAAVDTLRTASEGLDDEAAEGEEQQSVWDAVTVAKTGKFSLEGQDLAALLGQQIPGLGRSPWDRVPGIGKSPELAMDAFNLTEEKPVSDKVYVVGDARFLVALAEKESADESTLDEQRTMLVEEIRGAKIGAALGPWQGLFGYAMPADEYGPVLEKMLDQALKSNELKLYEENHAAVGMLKIGEDEPEIDLSAPPAKEQEKEES